MSQTHNENTCAMTEAIEKYVKAINLAAACVVAMGKPTHESAAMARYKKEELMLLSKSFIFPPFDGDMATYLAGLRKTLSDVVAGYLGVQGPAEYYELKYSILGEAKQHVAHFRSAAATDVARSMCLNQPFVSSASWHSVNILTTPLDGEASALSADVIVNLVEADADMSAIAAVRAVLIPYENVFTYGWAVQINATDHGYDSTMLYRTHADAVNGARSLCYITPVKNPAIKRIKDAKITHFDAIDVGDNFVGLSLHMARISTYFVGKFIGLTAHGPRFELVDPAKRIDK